MKPIRVLQVVVNMNAGGIENMLMNLYREIDREKLQFDFLLHTDEKCFFEDEIQSLGGRIYRIPRLKLTNLSIYLKDLNQFFQKHNYNIVHSHLNAWSYFVLRQAKINNCPVRIAHSHIAPNTIAKHGWFKYPFIVILKRLIHPTLTHRFACGEAAGKWLYGDKGFKVINNAINTDRFITNKKIAQKMKKDLNLDNRIIFGHVGRFTLQKNHDFMIDVFEAIKVKLPNAVLLLVGDGELRKKIEGVVKNKSLQDDVMFLGIRKDIDLLLQAFDFFLMPSLYEGLPVSLLEAQANGLKIFASDQISEETDITKSISFLPLDKGPEIWANEVLQFLDFEKTNNKELIVQAEYDIKSNAKSMQEFYLSNYKSYIQ